jgi:hypothetical protein
VFDRRQVVGAVEVLHGDLSTGLLTSFMIYALTLAMAFAFLSYDSVFFKLGLMLPKVAVRRLHAGGGGFRAHL